MNKIVISPCFNELHFLKHKIHNTCEYLQPDHFILADGMFPRGPENKTQEAELNIIIKNYTLNGEGKQSFDYRELENLLSECSSKYPSTKFYLIPMDYSNVKSHDEAYYKSYNIFRNFIKTNPDDLIFPLECDLFLTQEQSSTLLSLCKNLKPNHSLMSDYYQFFESPGVIMHTKRYRRLVYRYGDGKVWGCYKTFGSSHDSGIRAFHYEWIRPNRYFELRLLQLKREYTPVIRELKAIIRSKPDDLNTHLKNALKKLGSKVKDLPLEVSKIKLTDHPKHFHKHESFRYYYDE